MENIQQFVKSLNDSLAVNHFNFSAEVVSESSFSLAGLFLLTHNFESDKWSVSSLYAGEFDLPEQEMSLKNAIAFSVNQAAAYFCKNVFDSLGDSPSGKQNSMEIIESVPNGAKVIYDGMSVLVNALSLQNVIETFPQGMQFYLSNFDWGKGKIVFLVKDTISIGHESSGRGIKMMPDKWFLYSGSPARPYEQGRTKVNHLLYKKGIAVPNMLFPDLYSDVFFIDSNNGGYPSVLHLSIKNNDLPKYIAESIEEPKTIVETYSYDSFRFSKNNKKKVSLSKLFEFNKFPLFLLCADAKHMFAKSENIVIGVTIHQTALNPRSTVYFIKNKGVGYLFFYNYNALCQKPDSITIQDERLKKVEVAISWVVDGRGFKAQSSGEFESLVASLKIKVRDT